MSDQSQGPGWWLASDGKWYPPDQAPAVPPPETWSTPPVGPPRTPGMSTGAKVAIGLVGGFVALGLLAVLAVAFLGEETESRFEGTGDAIEGDGGTDGSDTATPAGYQVIAGDGVSIVVPESWDEIAPEDFAMTDEQFRQAFPNAPPEVLEQGNDFIDQGAVLVAFDPIGDFASNVNVIDLPGEAPLGIVEAQAESQLSTLGAQVHEVGRVDLPVGEALRIEFTVGVATPGGGTVDARGVQHYVPLDGRTYIVTISTVDDGALAATMIDTFRPD